MQEVFGLQDLQKSLPFHGDFVIENVKKSSRCIDVKKNYKNVDERTTLIREKKFSFLQKPQNRKIHQGKITKYKRIKKLKKKINLSIYSSKTRPDDSLTQNHFEKISKNLQREILGYIKPKDLGKVILVCKNWHNIFMDYKNPKILIDLINSHPQIPLIDYGRKVVDCLSKILEEHGWRIKGLNLKGYDLDSIHFQKMMECCPNLNYLFVSSDKITDHDLSYLEDMPLQEIVFFACDELTDAAFLHLEKMPLRSVDFSNCIRLTDVALSYLKGKLLQSVSFSSCCKLTDKALSYLEEMPLRSINFSYCSNLTDNAFIYLKGMKLNKVNFSYCWNLTNGGVLPCLKGMSLKSVDFNYTGVTEKAILKSLGIHGRAPVREYF